MRGKRVHGAFLPFLHRNRTPGRREERAEGKVSLAAEGACTANASVLPFSILLKKASMIPDFWRYPMSFPATGRQQQQQQQHQQHPCGDKGIASPSSEDAQLRQQQQQQHRLRRRPSQQGRRCSGESKVRTHTRENGSLLTGKREREGREGERKRSVEWR